MQGGGRVICSVQWVSCLQGRQKLTSRGKGSGILGSSHRYALGQLPGEHVVGQSRASWASGRGHSGT